MSPVLIIVIVIAAVVVVGLLAANPLLRKKEVAAIAVAKQSLGAPHTRIEPRTTAMGTEPETAGGLRGMGVLAVSPETLVFVLWSGARTFQVNRANISSVTTDATDIGAMHKATLQVHFADHEGADATALFRVTEPVPWLTELGYDWGPAGPPATILDDGLDDVDGTGVDSSDFGDDSSSSTSSDD